MRCGVGDIMSPTCSADAEHVRLLCCAPVLLATASARRKAVRFSQIVCGDILESSGVIRSQLFHLHNGFMQHGGHPGCEGSPGDGMPGRNLVPLIPAWPDPGRNCILLIRASVILISAWANSSLKPGPGSGGVDFSLGWRQAEMVFWGHVDSSLRPKSIPA